jgi:hypothetical protein
MGCVLAPVRDLNRAQLLEAPGEIHIFDHHLEAPCIDVLQGVLKGMTHEETLEDLEDCFRDQHLAAYCSQQKTRTLGVGEYLQEFVTAVEQQAHHTHPSTI